MTTGKIGRSRVTPIPENSEVGIAARTGDKLKLLKALRDRISSEIDVCPTRDLAPLTRRLQDIVADITELEQQAKQEKPRGRQGGRTDNAPWDPGQV